MDMLLEMLLYSLGDHMVSSAAAGSLGDIQSYWLNGVAYQMKFNYKYDYYNEQTKESEERSADSFSYNYIPEYRRQHITEMQSVIMTSNGKIRVFNAAKAAYIPGDGAVQAYIELNGKLVPLNKKNLTKKFKELKKKG